MEAFTLAGRNGSYSLCELPDGQSAIPLFRSPEEAMRFALRKKLIGQVDVHSIDGENAGQWALTMKRAGVELRLVDPPARANLATAHKASCMGLVLWLEFCTLGAA